MKVTVPIFAETEIENFIQKIIEFWETAKKLKQHYPSVWNSMKSQFWLDFWSDEKISESLYQRKLEIMILQDEERRKK